MKNAWANYQSVCHGLLCNTACRPSTQASTGHLGDAALHETVSLACRYKDVLGEAASQISQIYDASHTALVVNLGPAWLSGEAYELFNSNVIEIPFKDWESPPGLGICPLGVIFTVCSSIASWLALNEGNVVVSAEGTPHACPT